MVESRCGTLCSECDDFIEKKCVGCIALNGKASWKDEDCSLSRCVINKGLAHCGECSVFPCDMAVEMSHDEDVGDNGKRLEQCKIWARTNN
ncbi:MAG: DUF3795 domain-containing protein [Defluviitaleaceae bacterium]|nr:DUF3795 domain-containing protein [Defluviitaleaceae bacterium]